MLKNLLLLFCVSVAIAAETPRKPNVLVIISDDAGYAEFSMHGSKTIATPRIDSIAKNGMQFTQGYVSGSVCKKVCVLRSFITPRAVVPHVRA